MPAIVILAQLEARHCWRSQISGADTVGTVTAHHLASADVNYFTGRGRWQELEMSLMPRTTIDQRSSYAGRL